MTDSLNTTISITLHGSDRNTVTRFMNEIFSFKPGEYQSGKMTLEPDEADKILIESFNFVFFLADGEIGYKVGDIGDAEKKGTVFLHNGSPMDIFVTNNGTSKVEIEYFCANFI